MAARIPDMGIRLELMAEKIRVRRAVRDKALPFTTPRRYEESSRFTCWLSPASHTLYRADLWLHRATSAMSEGASGWRGIRGKVLKLDRGTIQLSVDRSFKGVSNSRVKYSAFAFSVLSGTESTVHRSNSARLAIRMNWNLSS
jgi:hypothetical protein